MLRKKAAQQNQDTTQQFVASMLQSAQENKQAQPQTRFGDVNPQQIEKVIDALKKGKLRPGTPP
ncbi:MAG TPA: hypothetical protein VJC21_02280 [Candidatus Nanoarchaeia archaeon]|nr:hypothetical protein [Candidatus Nanoarchaeia archaeon]